MQIIFKESQSLVLALEIVSWSACFFESQKRKVGKVVKHAGGRIVVPQVLVSYGVDEAYIMPVVEVRQLLIPFGIVFSREAYHVLRNVTCLF